MSKIKGSDFKSVSKDVNIFSDKPIVKMNEANIRKHHSHKHNKKK